MITTTTDEKNLNSFETVPHFPLRIAQVPREELRNTAFLPFGVQNDYAETSFLLTKNCPKREGGNRMAPERMGGSHSLPPLLQAE